MHHVHHVHQAEQRHHAGLRRKVELPMVSQAHGFYFNVVILQQIDFREEMQQCANGTRADQLQIASAKQSQHDKVVSSHSISLYLTHVLTLYRPLTARKGCLS